VALSDSDAVPAEAPSARRRRIIRWTVRLAVLGLASGYLVLVRLDGWFYYPNRTIYERPEDYSLKYEAVRLRTRDGLTLSGWFFPAVGRPARGTVVHFHGNAANISAHLCLVAWIPFEGYNLLMFDYRGYGGSEGRVSRAGTILDGHAALDYVRCRPDTAGLPVLVYGQSIGAAIAVVVAAERPEVAAVVAESPFASYRGIAALHLRRLLFWDPIARAFARLTVSDGCDPIAVVDRIAPRPLLVIVAGADRICFPQEGRALFAAARQPKELWEVPGASHLHLLDEHGSELVERVTAFFDPVCPSRSGSD
jgi:fermentation-respiration switch protein FrsA (DUF1100 family)